MNSLIFISNFLLNLLRFYGLIVCFITVRIVFLRLVRLCFLVSYCCKVIFVFLLVLLFWWTGLLVKFLAIPKLTFLASSDVVSKLVEHICQKLLTFAGDSCWSISFLCLFIMWPEITTLMAHSCLWHVRISSQLNLCSSPLLTLVWPNPFTAPSPQTFTEAFCLLAVEP